MSDVPAAPYRIAGTVFRVGRIFDRTISIYTRNFVPFSLVTLVASAPPLLLAFSAGTYSTTFSPANSAFVSLVSVLATAVLLLLSQATLVYGAFQDLCGKPVDLFESVNAGLRRFFPILVLTVFVAFVIMLFVFAMTLITYSAAFGISRFANMGLVIIPGFIVLIVVALMLIVRWSIAVPVCMVERLPPWSSLKRSSRLTKGHRWKLLGIILLLFGASFIVGKVIAVTLSAFGGYMIQQLVLLIWDVVWSAFFAIVVVVTYYELRSDKEGISVEQIAAVFD